MPYAHKLSQHSAPEQSRNRMIAAIHIKWKKLRPDLHLDPDALREERLAFITDALKLKRPLNSMRQLSDRQLGLALDALKRKEAQPQLPNSQAAPSPPSEIATGAEIIHLASAEQVFTINKLFNHLEWSIEARERFIKQRFKRSSPALLSPQNAHSLLRILLNIAAARDLRERGFAGQRLSRKQIGAEIPALKERLGIDRKGA